MKYPQLTNDFIAYKLKAVTERDDKRKVTDRFDLCLFALLFFFVPFFKRTDRAHQSLLRSVSKISYKKRS